MAVIVGNAANLPPQVIVAIVSRAVRNWPPLDRLALMSYLVGEHATDEWAALVCATLNPDAPESLQATIRHMVAAGDAARQFAHHDDLQRLEDLANRGQR